MLDDFLSEADARHLARDRARALAFIDRMRKLGFGIPIEGVISKLVPSERERDALAEAAASLYAKRKARARRARAATGSSDGRE